MTQLRYQWEPLEWTEDGWSWPPRHVPEEGKRSFVMRDTILAMEDVLWTLAREPNGAMEDPSGLVVNQLADKLAVWRSPHGALRDALLNLEALSLIERVKPSPQAKRTRRVALTIPIEELPGTDPHPQPTARQRAETILDELDEAAARDTKANGLSPSPDEEAVETPSEDVSFHFEMPTTPLEIRQLGQAIVDDVIRRAIEGPASSADRNHIASELEKARKRIRVLEQDVTIKDGNIKTLRVQLTDEQERHGRTLRNLEAAIAAAKDLAAQSGLTFSQDQQQYLERMMQRAKEPK